MRIIIISVLLQISLSADASTSDSVNFEASRPLKGMDVAHVMALQCGQENFGRFAAWVQKNNYLSADIPAFESPVTLKGASLSTSNGYALTVKGANQFEFKTPQKIYSGSDLCDVFLKVMEVKTAHHENFSLFSLAHAEEHKENTSGNYLGRLVGGTIAGVGVAAAVTSLAVTAPVWVPVAGMAAAVGGGLTWLNQNDKLKAKKAFEAVLSEGLTIDCASKSQMVVSNKEHKIFVDKSFAPNYSVEVIQLRSGGREKVIVNPSQAKKALGHQIVTEWAKECESSKDAERLMAEFETERKKTSDRIAGLLTNRTSVIDATVDAATSGRSTK